MIRLNIILLAGVLLFAACNRQKPKPISNNISKTKVVVNGKKDSVLNNQQRTYGNTTVSEPCVKCLLQVIQKSDSYKKATQSVNNKDIIYTVDWISPKNAPEKKDGDKINIGMKVDIIQKAGSQRVNLSKYLFDNTKAKLYLMNNEMKYEAEPVAIDSTSIKKIRNSCFWGVASSK